MSKSSFQERARASFSRLSATHQRVVEYVLGFPHEAAFLSAAELGRRAQSSDATVVRLATALGYENFLEMRAGLQQELITAATPAGRLTSSRMAASVAQIVDLDIQNLTLLKETLSEETIRAAAKMVQAAGHIFVSGVRGSYASAFWCYQQLRQIRPTVTLLTLTGGNVADDLVPMEKSDLLITFSTRRYSAVTLEMGTFAAELGAKVLSVSDSALAPISQIADLCVVISSRSGSFFPSNAAAHVFVNVLITFLSMQNRRESEKRLTRIDGVLERFHSFATESDK